jgi:hypothetical protein
MEMSVQLQFSAVLTPEKELVGSWVGLKAGMDAAKKRKASCRCRESNTAVQPVAHHYID